VCARGCGIHQWRARKARQRVRQGISRRVVPDDAPPAIHASCPSRTALLPGDGLRTTPTSTEPASSQACTSRSSVSSATSSMPGWRERKRRSNGGSTVAKTLGKAASRTEPASSPIVSAASFRIASRWENAARACSSARSPKAVSSTPCLWRTSSFTPKLSSSAVNAWLMPDWVMPTPSAAAVKLPAWATAIRLRSCVRFIVVKLIDGI